MNIHNEITVQAPADELFAFLSDVERVAPCLPGASIDGKDGEDYAGSMKVKVGPITATYQGKMRFLELDRDARRAVMRARAQEVNGQGNAEAKITSEVEEAGAESVIRMDTDLQMRGKVAQFGRGAMEKISQRMFAEFAHNIEQQFSGDGAATESARPEGAEPETAERPEGAEPETAERPEGAEPEAGGEAPARRAGGEAPAERERAGGEGAAMNLAGMIGLPKLGAVAPYLATAAVALGYGYLLGRLRESRATVGKLVRML